MLQHMFATMNELLDDIIQQYPSVQGTAKQELDRQLALLRTMSDHIVEEWLRFEEKLAIIRTAANSGTKLNAAAASSLKNLMDNAEKEMVEAAEFQIPDYSDPFQRGQGYFTLRMYKQAVNYLENAVVRQPDKCLIRILLGLSYLHLGRNQEACRHLHFIIPLTDDPKLKAIAYNALGCIQMLHSNTEKAQHYFHKAHFTDPSIPEPIANLKVCTNKCGSLQFGEKRVVSIV
ncbi:tetratricopeptide repeat protein [Paenibacillus marinisediminis]